MHIQKIIFGTFSPLLIFFLSACNSSQTQNNQIKAPEIVDKAFTEKYSHIPRVWEKTNYGYEATYMQNNIKYEAEFSDTGEWLETEYYVAGEEFPDIVLKRIHQEYPNFKITKYEIEITPEGNFYEVDITDGEIEYELYFDVNGNRQLDLYED
ncbi:PepSY-like domain-containing protein [Nostoc sp. LEGE 06077]|uniref:PepSY-like domain-containing protein n=1 Tax=Nostoc sp. LEGE 06077 TaxID=915325 RepID=UPI00187FD441|nr:PepSY-like domain-containing protein [Nostoc sp. LEGE 06077]MBE9205982.1 PepSY-like domain-containing protein [Nostoc sp. LEGE 06077]